MDTALNQITVSMENIYQMILDCYRSGQIDEARWQIHLGNPEFKKWVDSREGE